MRHVNPADRSSTRRPQQHKRNTPGTQPTTPFDVSQAARKKSPRKRAQTNTRAQNIPIVILANTPRTLLNRPQTKTTPQTDQNQQPTRQRPWCTPQHVPDFFSQVNIKPDHNTNMEKNEILKQLAEISKRINEKEEVCAKEKEERTTTENGYQQQADIQQQHIKTLTNNFENEK